VANLKYSGHLISVSVIFDTPAQYHFTPFVEIRRGNSAEVLNTILTHHVFIIQGKAIDLGFKLGREWIDKPDFGILKSEPSGAANTPSTKALLEQSQRLQDHSSGLHGAFSKEAIGQLSRNSSATPDGSRPSCSTTFLPNSQKFADNFRQRQ
jgi:hypothetical protein